LSSINALLNVCFSTDSSIDLDCSLENDDAEIALLPTTLQLPIHQHDESNNSINALDRPFGMDLSVEFGTVSPQVGN
jgi:hypothetical protein